MMSNIFVDRIFNICPEVDCSDHYAYPVASDWEFYVMEETFSADPSVPQLFPYVHIDASGHRFMDLYIWDKDLHEKGVERFIILDGYCLSSELEIKLLEYIHSKSICVDKSRMQNFNHEVMHFFPNWHYVDYPGSKVCIALEHLYYSSHRSGVKEMLYKSNLENIAFSLDIIPECNLNAASPEEIVNCTLPIKLLRILNQDALINNMFDYSKIMHCAAVYQAYSDYIGKALPSANQWRYLDCLYQNNGEFAGHGFISALYKKLSSSDNEPIFQAYERFLTLKDIYSNIKQIRIPFSSDVENVVETLEKYEKYRTGQHIIDEKIKERKIKDTYSYKGDAYSVIMPASSMDFIRESIIQGNCIMNYIDMHASGETTILFVRKNTDLNMPFVTIEVESETIYQAYGRFNCLPKVDVYEFLMDYARHKWLLCNPYDLIFNNLDEDFYTDPEANSNELTEYALRFRINEAINNATEIDSYEQMTLEKCFPQVFNG